MKYCIIFIFAFILGACQDVKTPERPANLIDKDKMATILVESYLINAAKSVDNKSIMESGIVLDSVFYSRFNVDSLQFSQSNAYYAANVNKYMALFEEVESRLNEMQQKLDSVRAETTPLKDSPSE